jgi:DNA replication protein DnaC
MASLKRSIPPTYAWATLDAPELPERVYAPAIVIGQTVCHEPRVCLMGASRSGKTSLAVAMMRAWVVKQERPALFVAAHRLGMARLQHPAGHGEAELVETAMRAPLVLLDDLGSEREFTMSPVADVIFERHAQDLPTWITTGLARDPLVARYGAGVVARLFERARVISLSPRGSFEKNDMPRK